MDLFGMHIFHQSPSSARYSFYRPMEGWKAVSTCWQWGSNLPPLARVKCANLANWASLAGHHGFCECICRCPRPHSHISPMFSDVSINASQGLLTSVQSWRTQNCPPYVHWYYFYTLVQRGCDLLRHCPMSIPLGGVVGWIPTHPHLYLFLDFSATKIL